ncbi:TonB-dependent receptor [Myxococcus sp. RHSTA-1-4]|uniref:TonB-dependent receptor n=1 Tax=Myxococcus sp. RHSTA-1-4 TaxID=2874601 RepID=UPI001CBE09A4|nr:TonB-dependent receptor [Myxococcus sp. RHSTA-1-4]
MNVPSTGVATAQQPASPADGTTAQQPAAPVDGATAQQPTAPAGTATAQQPTAPADGAIAQPGDAVPSEATASEGDAMSDEAMLAESAEPPAGFTGIHGRVVDEANQEGLIEATVKVVTGAQKQALTDLDGNYRLALPPGKYDLRVFYDVYQGRRITGVVVTQGKATKLDVALSADVGAVQEVVVEARADRRAEGALLQERKKAAAVSDAISAQEIARTPDSSASDAVKRVVSATVVDGRYVLLRGLGGRYSTTLLNGAILPSPEPDEQAVPLDIFPTALLANLNVNKSYTADMPGTFAGGALLIETNNYPASFELKPRLTLSGDSLATFQTRNTYAGGSLDWLGFDDGTRALPDSVPTDRPLNRLTRDEVNTIARDFPNTWTTGSKRALVNMGLGVSVGDTLRFDNQRLGYLASVNYSHREVLQRSQFIGTTLDETDGEGVQVDESSESVMGAEIASLGGLLSAGYQPHRDMELSVFSLFTRTGESRARVTTGQDQSNETFRNTSSEYLARMLTFNQVRGFHRLSGVLNDMELDWQANLSYVQRDDPDTRSLTYELTSQSEYRFRQDPGGLRWYSTLGETSYGASVNATFPLSTVRLRVGAMAQQADRSLDMRRFRFRYTSGNLGVVFEGPEDIFASGNIGNGIGLEENTNAEDAYEATQGIYAGYVNADISTLDPLRIVAGVRYEASVQKLETGSPYANNPYQATNTDRTYSDVLPALNLIYALTPAVNLRTGYSYTLARPTFRELAPILYYDFVRRRSVSGKPGLSETRIHNLDARAEWFPGESEVLAASVFYKRFQNPIERIIVTPAQRDVSFENSQGATSYGVELEARTTLGRITPALSNVRAGFNLTLTQSEIELQEGGLQTSQTRPLQGQSPYVVNVNLGWLRAQSGTELSLLYNVFGRRISDVGISGVPDVYEQPFHRVDLALSQDLGRGMHLKLTGTNLLNRFVVLKQGDLEVLKYRPGAAFSASLGWSL